jgi:hypothetical protein
MPVKKTMKPAKGAAAPMTLAEAMRELEKAGSTQTRKTYARHGAPEPMFGVSFATLKTLRKRIGVDHELALALWSTGNYDARNLAVKIADPAKMSAADLDRWVRDDSPSRMFCSYIAMLAAEGSHPVGKAAQWLGAADEVARVTGWRLLGQLAQHDETTPDAWFLEHLAKIERTIHAAPNSEREAMNLAVIMIGCRNAALRKTATAAAKRIGAVDVDHGDTACKTPDAASYIEKTWTHSTAKGFESPAAHERSREPMRLRC